MNLRRNRYWPPHVLVNPRGSCDEGRRPCRRHGDNDASGRTWATRKGGGVRLKPVEEQVVAAVSIFAPFDETTPEEFRRVIDIDLLGQAYGAMAALGHLKREGRGALVHVTSVVARRAVPLQSVPTAPPSTAWTASWSPCASSSRERVGR
jgi:hypothetical protein